MSQILWAFEWGELLYRNGEEVVAASEESFTLASQFRRFISIGWLAHSGQLTSAGAAVPPIITLAGFRVCVIGAYSLPPPSAEYRLSFLRLLDDTLQRYEEFLHSITY